MILYRYQPIVTVGDEKNDIAMIQEFHGYAMRDSRPDLLAMVESGHVVGSVAELINKKRGAHLGAPSLRGFG